MNTMINASNQLIFQNTPRATSAFSEMQDCNYMALSKGHVSDSNTTSRLYKTDSWEIHL